VQREFYGFYLGVYEAVLYSIKPNITAQDVVKAALPKMDKILSTTRFSKQIYQVAAKEYVERYRRIANPDTVGANRGRGANLTSDFVPRSIAAVEKTIAESGLLQTYGRINQR
jgi:hypothetical protein